MARTSNKNPVKVTSKRSKDSVKRNAKKQYKKGPTARGKIA